MRMQLKLRKKYFFMMRNLKNKEEMPINICFTNRVARIRKQNLNHNLQAKKYKVKEFNSLSSS